MYFPVAVSTLDTLESLRSSVVASKLAGMSALAATIAGLLAGVTLLRMSHDYVSGRGLTFWELVRPFVLLLLVARFNTFVATPLHSIVNIGSNGISNLVSGEEQRFYEVLGTAVNSTFKNSAASLGETVGESIDDYENGGTDDGSTWSKVESFFRKGVGAVMSTATDAIGVMLSQSLDRVRSVFGNIFKWFFKGPIEAICIKAGISFDSENFINYPLISTMSLLLCFFLKFIVLGLHCQCYIFLILLSLLGPFSFALAIIPSYKHQVNSWIARYISIALWIPVSKIVMFVSYSLLKNMAAVELGLTGGTSWILIVCLIVVIRCLMKVPAMSSYIIDSAGAGAAEGGNPVTGLISSVGKASGRFM